MKEKNENNLEDISKFNIVLGQYTRNGMKLLTAKYNMSESDIVSMALNKLIKTEFLTPKEIDILYDDPETERWVKIQMDANKGLVETAVNYEDIPDNYSP